MALLETGLISTTQQPPDGGCFIEFDGNNVFPHFPIREIPSAGNQDAIARLNDDLNNLHAGAKELFIGTFAVIQARADLSTLLCSEYRPKGVWEKDESSSKLLIPTERVTAARALEFPLNDGSFQPVVDLRIQTRSDETTGYFAGPGRIVEQASPGSWFRFKLAYTKLVLLG